MQDWLDTITVGEAIAWVAGITAAVAALIPAGRFVASLVMGTRQFLMDWNGVPPRKDRSGKIIDPGKPGIPGLLERVRKQVENDHSTNFREDLDGVKETVEKVSAKLDEHIAISKHQDRQQDRTARQLAEHIRQTDQLLPMLEDLHRQWSKRQQPDPTI